MYKYEPCLQIFSGNYDRYIIVQHKFAKPLYGRYFRVYPVAWYSWIGMRVEFYGCVYGKNFFHNVVLFLNASRAERLNEMNSVRET